MADLERYLKGMLSEKSAKTFRFNKEESFLYTVCEIDSA